MTRMTHQELTRWLGEATRGLPKRAAATVRDEISAHYADAVAHHRAEGQSEDEAHRAAMADLGDVRPVARALRDAHLARRRYAVAAAACLVYPVTLSLLPTLETGLALSNVTAELIYYLGAVTSILFALNGLKRLLGYQGRRTECLFRLIAWSFVVADIAILISWVIFGDTIITGTTRRGLGDPATLLQAAIDWIDLGAELLGGAGVLALSAHLASQENPLYGLRGLVRALAAIVGSTVILAALTTALNWYVPAVLTTILGMLSLVITFAVLSLLFFRAAYRGTARPLRIV